jgi:hypothetical protein
MSQIIRRRESLVLCKSFNTLWPRLMRMGEGELYEETESRICGRREGTVYEIAKAKGRRLIFEREQAVGTGAATQRWILQLVFQKRSIC